MRHQATQATSADRTFVRDHVHRAGTSFYWAMRLLPVVKRDALFAVYSFCRAVDDIADGPATQETKIEQLAQWRDRIKAVYTGRADDALMRLLLDAIPRFGLAAADFQSMIDGMEMDATGPIVAPSWDVLDLYCDRVASSVGRLCVPIFGQPGPLGERVAHHLGRALQLTNILRDVHEDAELGRLYLPAEALGAARVVAQDPPHAAEHPRIAEACRLVGVRAQVHFSAAQEAIEACNPTAMRPARIMKDIYRPILDQIEQNGWQPVPEQRPTGLKRAQKIGHRLWIAVTRSVF